MKGFDLFAGIGGFHEGAKMLLGDSYESIAFSDIDDKARQAYKLHFQKKIPIELGDITDITLSNTNVSFGIKVIDSIQNNIPDHDILFAGFPCQPFSSMGKRKGFKDSRGTLFFDIETIIRVKKPNYIILENVRGLLTIQKGKVMEYIIHSLKREGYEVAYWLLNGSDYGIAQTRRRVFIIGRRDARHKAIESSSPPPKVDRNRLLTRSIKNLLDKNVDQKYYLSEKIKKTILSNGTGGYSYKAEINMDPARPLTYTMHKMHRASQDNYYSDKFIKGGSSHRIRRITPYEALKIQGFSNSFSKKLLNSGFSDTQIYKFAGNAVSPIMVKNILKHVL